MSKRLTPPNEASLAAALQAAENSLGQSGCDAIAVAVVVVRQGEDGLPDTRCVIVPPHICSAGSVAAFLFLAARDAGAGAGIHFPDPVPIEQANLLHAYKGSGRGKARVN